MDYRTDHLPFFLLQQRILRDVLDPVAQVTFLFLNVCRRLRDRLRDDPVTKQIQRCKEPAEEHAETGEAIGCLLRLPAEKTDHNGFEQDQDQRSPDGIKEQDARGQFVRQNTDHVNDGQPACHDREKPGSRPEFFDQAFIVQQLFADRTVLAFVFSAGDDDIFFKEGTVSI